MQTLCPVINHNESLNYSNLTVTLANARYSTSTLTVYPFTNCHPYGREEAIKKWNKIACIIFPHVKSSTVKLDTFNKEAEGYDEYRIEHFPDRSKSDDGIFTITAQIDGKLFNQEQALKAIQTSMIYIITKINEVIETAWKHSRMLECFPEFINTAVTQELYHIIKLTSSDLKKLKDDIGQIKPGRSDESLTTQFSIIENEVEKLKLTVAKHIFDINTLRTKINKPKRKRPRR